MIAWDTIEAACEAFVRRVVQSSGLATERRCNDVVWRDKAKGHLEAPYIELAIQGERQVGNDDIEYVDGADSLTPRVSGVREFTLEVSCRCRDQSALGAARNHLERVRSGLNHAGLREVLRAGGVSYLTSQPLRTIPFVHENRKESLAVLEIRLCARSLFYDASEGVDYAETADVTVTVDGGAPSTVNLE